MGQKSLAYINPKMLKFTREQSGLSLEEVAKLYLSPKERKNNYLGIRG